MTVELINASVYLLIKLELQIAVTYCGVITSETQHKDIPCTSFTLFALKQNFKSFELLVPFIADHLNPSLK